MDARNEGMSSKLSNFGIAGMLSPSLWSVTDGVPFTPVVVMQVSFRVGDGVTLKKVRKESGQFRFVPFNGVEHYY